MDINSWICKFVLYSIAYLECAFSEECVEKLVHGVLLLYLVICSALKRWLLVAARVRRELQGSADNL